MTTTGLCSFFFPYPMKLLTLSLSLSYPLSLINYILYIYRHQTTKQCNLISLQIFFYDAASLMESNYILLFLINFSTHLWRSKWNRRKNKKTWISLNELKENPEDCFRPAALKRTQKDVNSLLFFGFTFRCLGNIYTFIWDIINHWLSLIRIRLTSK